VWQDLAANFTKEKRIENGGKKDEKIFWFFFAFLLVHLSFSLLG
jgi:hypothetical protein